MSAPNEYLLPDYPRTRHLFWKPNATRDDLIAAEEECRIIFTSPYLDITEKVDAANLGMHSLPEAPLIRNRNHFLTKTHQGRTPAKTQFNQVWNWYYENKHCFETLNEQYGHPVSVYGEWMVALHSVPYDKLPSYFVTYDIFDPEEQKFVDPARAHELLHQSGFTTAPQLLVNTNPTSYSQLESLAYGVSEFTTKAPREGIYIKVSDGKWVTHRFKMVRNGFIQGEHWNKQELRKNSLRKL
jgi:atypical dual specificity phosphatase